MALPPPSVEAGRGGGDDLEPREPDPSTASDYEVGLESLSQWQLAWRKFRKHRLALVGSVILLVLVVTAILAPILSPFSFTDVPEPDVIVPKGRPPSPQHIFGETGGLQRDVFQLVINGARTSLFVGFSSMLIGVILGTIVGTIAGFFGGISDNILMRVVDVMLALPLLFVILVASRFFGNGNPSLIVIIFGLFSWMGVSRLVRSLFLSLREQDFVEAARAVGVSEVRIAFRHILPNAVSPIVVVASLLVAGNIIAEAFVSFLGFGILQTPTWGNVLTNALTFIPVGNWWWPFFPGMAIVLTVLAVNFIGDGLRDALDPQVPRMTADVDAPPARPTGSPPPADLLLDVRGLRTEFRTMDGIVHAVDGVDFSVPRSRSLGVVGESGSGKSVTALTILRLLESNATVTGEVWFDGRELLGLPMKQIEALRGKDIAMIFQEPLTSLNPVFTVGDQISEQVRRHLRVNKKEAWGRAIESLRLVGIPTPERRVKQYPHELSGGMRQRVMIAMALSCEPKLLIADEPTTALDVTIQAQILELLKEIQVRTQSALLLITHDLGVVAEMVDEVVVMYTGQVVERGSVEDVLLRPASPYTVGLIESIPSVEKRGGRLHAIKGAVASPFNLPPACRFEPRCPYAWDDCQKTPPDLYPAGPHGQIARCLLHTSLGAGRRTALEADRERVTRVAMAFGDGMGQ